MLFHKLNFIKEGSQHFHVVIVSLRLTRAPQMGCKRSAVGAVFFFTLTLDLRDYIHFNFSPLKMCSSMNYTCMPNIKLLSSILQKLLANVKVFG